jgi:hypothetical protein
MGKKEKKVIAPTTKKCEELITCFNEIGNVNLPHCSGVWTISFVTALQDLHTEAQATTTARAGQEVSVSSTLRIISRSNSDGILAHCPCSIGSSDVKVISGTMCDFVRRCESLLPAPRLDVLPIPSLISLSSRTMLLNDIFAQHTNLTSTTITANIKTDPKSFSIPDMRKHA